MKKIMPIVFIIALAACGKNTNTNGGSWVFKNQTYKATQAFYVLGGLAAYTGTGSPTGSMTLWFRDSAGLGTNWPPQHRIYSLSNNYPPDSGQAFMQITDTAIRNSWVVTSNKIVYITVDTLSNGFHTITIPPVEVINNNDTIDPLNPLAFIRIGGRSGTDSSLLSGTIIQTK